MLKVQKKYKGNRRKRCVRIRRIKVCFAGIFVAIIILVIYLSVSITNLICKTLEYAEHNQIHEYHREEVVYATNKKETLSEDVIKTEYEIVLEKLEIFALEHDFSVEEYPEELLELLMKNPETETFVLNYPLQKGSYCTESLEEALNQTQIPLFLQWDNRWGYYTYGDKAMGVNGCGPTCLSMVALHLLQNSQMTPQYVAEFSQRNGFYVEGTGTAWTLMTQGAAELGLYAREVPLDEDLIFRYLSQGKPIICAMGRGDFTENGHFIVFVGMEEGKIPFVCKRKGLEILESKC